MRDENLRIVRIKVPNFFINEWGGAGPDKIYNDGEFNLGPGRCGRNVVKLDGWQSTDFYVVEQFHEDGTKKIFRYPIAQITGRVEEEYARLDG